MKGQSWANFARGEAIRFGKFIVFGKSMGKIHETIHDDHDASMGKSILNLG